MSARYTLITAVLIVLTLVVGCDVQPPPTPVSEATPPTRSVLWSATLVLSTASPMPPTATPVSETTPTVKAIVPEMVLVEAGAFEMGSAAGRPDEQPVHTVQITRAFYIARYEVTFEEYDRFCEDTGARKPGDRGWDRGRQPVVNVDWYDAVAYCNWLSEKEGLSPCYSGKGRLTQCDFLADGYRLPTEAEWEYAARGGHLSQGYIYAGSNDPDAVAWYAANSDGTTHPVGQKQPNELGLYDMSGNMYEWCWDWYGEDYYVVSPASDPTGPPPTQLKTPRGPNKVRRSSAWREDVEYLRVAFRSFDYAAYAGDNGFRLARTK